MQLLRWLSKCIMARVMPRLSCICLHGFSFCLPKKLSTHMRETLHRPTLIHAYTVKPAVDLEHLQALAAEARQSQQWQSALAVVQDLFCSPETLAISFMPPCAAVSSPFVALGVEAHRSALRLCASLFFCSHQVCVLNGCQAIDSDCRQMCQVQLTGPLWSNCSQLSGEPPSMQLSFFSADARSQLEQQHR